MGAREDQAERVETMIEAGMTAASVYESRQVRNARRIWRDFCRLETPAGDEPGPWAGAAEYAVVRIDFVEGVTQASIGRRYGVSARGISTRFSRIQDRLALMPFDPRYATETLDEEGDFDYLDGLVPDDDEGADDLQPGAPFAEVKDTAEFEEDVRDLVATGRPFSWIVSNVARLHAPEGIEEYQRLVDLIQDVWNTTPREDLNGRTPEQADLEV